MSRGRNDGMSGANNIPLGHRGPGGGTLAAAASTLGGVSLLNPSYLAGSDSGDSHHQRPSSSSSGRRSKFGPPVEGIGPPPVVNDFGSRFNQFNEFDEPSRKRPNMELINNINAQILGKVKSESPDSKMGMTEEERRAERKRKRKSRWGGDDGAEKTFIPGMPTMMPQGLSADQEEAYLRKSIN